MAAAFLRATALAEKEKGKKKSISLAPSSYN